MTALVSAFVKMATSTSRSSNKKSNGSESPKKGGSPKKKNLLEVKVSSSKQARRVTYLFRIMKLKPDIEIIWCDKTPRDDAFIHHLVKHIEEENGFREQGVLMVCRRRMGRLDNSIRFNENDAFPRRLIVRVVDESTAQDRMAVLMLLCAFMMRPENNRYSVTNIRSMKRVISPPKTPRNWNRPTPTFQTIPLSISSRPCTKTLTTGGMPTTRKPRRNTSPMRPIPVMLSNSLVIQMQPFRMETSLRLVSIRLRMNKQF